MMISKSFKICIFSSFKVISSISLKVLTVGTSPGYNEAYGFSLKLKTSRANIAPRPPSTKAEPPEPRTIRLIFSV
jgi:hypothetical protein